MSKRISKRTRDHAIHILAICQSASCHHLVLLSEIAVNLGLQNSSMDPWCAALDLAFEAHCAVDTPIDRDGEAEGLLRDGWCPGDPVVRR